MSDRPCAGCGAPITPGVRERNQRRWCSEACRVRTFRTGSGASPTISCRWCGVEIPGAKRGKKWCSVVCKGRAQRARRPNLPELHTCQECGVEFTRPPTKGQKPKWCKGCGGGGRWRRQNLEDAVAYERDRQIRRSYIESIKREERERQSRLPVLHPRPWEPLPEPKRWAFFVAGRCRWCEEPFTAPAWTRRHAPVYCGERCKKAAVRAKRGKFSISPVTRAAIYERDGWVCQLCLEPVEPGLQTRDIWSATLDHIVCQAWGEEPDHSPSNLRLAHRWCNSVRGDERYYDEDFLRPLSA